MGQLIHHTIVEEGILRRPDRAPITKRELLLTAVAANTVIGNIKRLIPRGLYGCRVWPRDRHAPTAHSRFHSRGGNKLPIQRGKFSVLELTLKPRRRHRAVHIAAHIILARPEQFNRTPISLHRDLNRLHHIIIFAAAAKSTAHHQRVNMDIIHIQTCDLSGPLFHIKRRLCPDPNIKAAIFKLRSGIHRLHCRMGQIRHAIFTFNDIAIFKCSLNVSIISFLAVQMLVVKLRSKSGELSVREFTELWHVKLCCNFLRRLHGGPAITRQNGHPIRDRNNPFNTVHIFCR